MFYFDLKNLKYNDKIFILIQDKHQQFSDLTTIQVKVITLHNYLMIHYL